MIKKIILPIFLLLSLFIIPERVLATEASARCSPTTGTYTVGQTFTVDYTLDTRGFPIYGADIEATYDQAIIEAVGTSSTAVTTGTKWTTPTTNKIDVSSGKTGKISLDYGKAQTAYTGSGSVGQIQFKAKAAGQATFAYTFFQQYDDTTPGVIKVWGKKDGTNITNILTDVNNCIYVITEAETSPTPTTPPNVTPAVKCGEICNPTSKPCESSLTCTQANNGSYYCTMPANEQACKASPGNAACCTSPQQPPTTELPRTGAVEVTMILLGIAGAFLTIGYLIPKVVFKED
jgi:hypothetical protein